VRARQVAGALAAGRVVIGLGLIAVPGPIAGPWMGRAAVEDPGSRIAVQALGIRDAAMGAGLLAAVVRGASDGEVARWAAAGVVSDVVDGVATIVSGRATGGARRSAAVAFSAAVTGAAVTALLRRR
jgi:hypothetical protein